MTSVATDGGAETRPPLGERDVLRRVTEISEAIREHALEGHRLVDERNAAVRDAIDRYGCSQRQVARAAGLSIGRIHGILAND